jgi:hypothetical protein
MKNPGKNNRRVLIASTCVYCIFSPSHVAWALNITARPSVTVNEIYSDNISLAPSGSEKSAFVTEVSPGLSVFGLAPRYRFNLNYRLQGLYNAGGTSDFDINHQLNYNSNYVVAPSRLFLDTRSTISQQNINNNRLITDNVVGSENTSTVTTFGLSPYWTPHFSNYANGIARVSYDRVTSDAGELSDTDNFTQTIGLTSGRYFSKINWSANFNNQMNQRADGDDVNFQNSSGLIRYNLNRLFSVFAQGGHSSNDFETTTDTNQNGFFYTFGGTWQPSRIFSLTAGGGNNSFVTVYVAPIQRLQWTTTYRNNDIGTNTGSVWQTNLRYFTRRSVWGVTYNEDTTTVQQVILEQQLQGGLFGNNPNNLNDPNDPNLFGRNLGLPLFIDEVFVRKRAQISYSYNTGKSVLSAQAFTETRDYEVQNTQDEVYGISGSWSWRYSPKMTTFLRSNWQNTDANTVANEPSSSNQLIDASIGLSRVLGRNVRGNLEYRYFKQMSDVTENEYDENRITLGLSAFF